MVMLHRMLSCLLLLNPEVLSGKKRGGFFQRVQAKVKNRLTPKEEELASWSALGFCNYYHQALSVANLKGLGHFFSVAAAVLRPS